MQIEQLSLNTSNLFTNIYVLTWGWNFKSADYAFKYTSDSI